MNRRAFISNSAASAAVLAFPALTGCSKGDPTTLANLAVTIGQAAASLATILGNSAAAAQIMKYATIVSADIRAWVPGSPTADITQAIADLEGAITLLPVNAETQALIALALGTIQAILAFFPGAPAAVTAKAVKPIPQYPMAHPPKNSKQFSDQWNTLLSHQPKFAAAMLP